MSPSPIIGLPVNHVFGSSVKPVFRSPVNHVFGSAVNQKHEKTKSVRKCKENEKFYIEIGKHEKCIETGEHEKCLELGELKRCLEKGQHEKCLVPQTNSYGSQSSNGIIDFRTSMSDFFVTPFDPPRSIFAL